MKGTSGASGNGIENSNQRRAQRAQSARAEHDRFLINKVRAIRMDMWTPSIDRQLAQLVKRFSQ